MHNIDETVTGGAFASVREIPWHQLGVILDEPTSTLGILQAAHCDFDVLSAPVKIDQVVDLGTPDMPFHVRYEATDTRNVAIYRVHPQTGEAQILGIASPTYQLWTPRDVFETFVDAFLNQLRTVGKAVETATCGALDEGRQVFMSLKLPQDIRVGGDDVVQLYLTLHTSFDQSSATSAMISPVRVVCANTLAAARGSVVDSFSIKRTKNADLQAKAARAADSLIGEYVTALRDQSEKLINTKVGNQQFYQLISELWGPDKDAGKTTMTTWQKKADELMDLFCNAPTQEAGRGTAWAAYNAVTERQDWFSRGSNKPGDRFARSLGLSDNRTLVQPKTDMLSRLMDLVSA